MFHTMGERATVNSNTRNARKRARSSMNSFSVMSAAGPVEEILPKAKPVRRRSIA